MKKQTTLLLEVPRGASVSYANEIESLLNKTCLSARGHALVNMLRFGYHIMTGEYEEAKRHLYEAYKLSMMIGMTEVERLITAHLWKVGHMLE